MIATNKLLLSVTAVVACSILSCATIINGSDQMITVNSNVPGADVYLNQLALGKTPLTLKIKRGQEGVLQVQADGYVPFTFALNSEVSGVFWINIITGGLFGSSTDYSTKAMYQYEPSTFYAPLQPATATHAALDKLLKREALRRYVLVNHESIVHDLARSHGPYLETMTGALRIADADKEVHLHRWMFAAEQAPSSLAFAEAIVAELD